MWKKIWKKGKFIEIPLLKTNMATCSIIWDSVISELTCYSV